MKGLAAISALILAFFLMVSLPTLAQDNDKDKPAAQDEKAKDRDKGQNSPQRDDRAARPDEQKDHDARRQQEQEQHERHEARPENQSRPQEDRDRHVDRDRQQNPAQGHRGARIPDDRFRAGFGREHRFHVDRARVYQQQQPIVVYGGYTFQLVEAWPAAWSYDDDCYIDYDNVDGQYYLYDMYHPGFRVAVFVVQY